MLQTNCRSGWSVSLFAAILLLTLPTQPLAAEEAAYLSAYKAYQSAFESGQVSTAIEQGYAAWKLAEEALGDHQTTAVLAYNYARLGSSYPEQVDAARSAFDRAAALTAKGIGPLDAAEVAVGRAELSVLLNPEDETAIDELSAQLGDPQAASSAASLVKAQAWRTLGSAQLRSREPLEAYRSAAKAVALAENLSPSDPALLRSALLTKAMANLSRASRRRMQDVLIEAASDLDQAIALFPVQESIRQFDPGLAQTIIWREATRMKFMSQLRNRRGRNRPEEELIGPVDFSSILWERDPEKADCPSIGPYIEQSVPLYPYSESKDGKVGAVLYGVTLTTSGIGDIVILGEPEGTSFGASAKREIERWSMREGYPERCLPVDSIGTIMFGFR